jgi:hypothetical protein
MADQGQVVLRASEASDWPEARASKVKGLDLDKLLNELREDSWER